jgi:hypothetical protein
MISHHYIILKGRGVMILHRQNNPYFCGANFKFMKYIAAYLLKARTVKPAETAVAREWLCDSYLMQQ